MPTGLRRYYGDDHLHFLTCSCYHRQPWLGGGGGRDLFLRIFEQARQRHGFVVVGYVVMPDHIHLLTEVMKRASPRVCGQSSGSAIWSAGRLMESQAPAVAEPGRAPAPGPMDRGTGRWKCGWLSR